MIPLSSINDLLIVILVVQLVFFFFMLYQIMKLQSLIKEEHYDLGRFESDLKLLERKGEHKASEPSNALKEYVNKALSRGFSVEQIRGKLLSRGWRAEQVDKVLPVSKSGSQVKA